MAGEARGGPWRLTRGRSRCRSREMASLQARADDDPEAEHTKRSKRNVRTVRGASKALARLKAAFSAKQLLVAAKKVGGLSPAGPGVVCRMPAVVAPAAPPAPTPPPRACLQLEEDMANAEKEGYLDERKGKRDGMGIVRTPSMRQKLGQMKKGGELREEDGGGGGEAQGPVRRAEEGHGALHAGGRERGERRHSPPPHGHPAHQAGRPAGQARRRVQQAPEAAERGREGLRAAAAREHAVRMGRDWGRAPCRPPRKPRGIEFLGLPSRSVKENAAVVIQKNVRMWLAIRKRLQLEEEKAEKHRKYLASLKDQERK